MFDLLVASISKFFDAQLFNEINKPAGPDPFSPSCSKC